MEGRGGEGRGKKGRRGGGGEEETRQRYINTSWYVCVCSKHECMNVAHRKLCACDYNMH